VRVHVVVPEGFDDPGQPTGGNIYDRRVCAGVAEAGWEVLVERSVLRAAAGVVVASDGTRPHVLTRYAIPACRMHVARPGADRVAAPARPVRGHLICVGVLGRHKGQDLLVEALADLAERDWHCVLAGPLDRDPDFVDQLQTCITSLGYGHRVRFTGVLTGAALSHAYTTSDLLVAPSRSETYGMTVTEALAHGLPVIAAAVGGLPEALGSTSDGTRPGQLVPPGDPAALAAALGDWLGDERHRHRLRAAARRRRSTLRGWEQTTQEIANALTAHGCRKPVPTGVDNHPEKTSGPA
jgi:glycosyltransferase involved in cell wall biosynthesis